MKFYPHHIGDYAQDTRHLSMLEHGAYRALLDLYYSREAPFPLDVAAVQRLACTRTRDERAAVESVLREFFVESDTGWRHTRCDKEIEAGHRRIDASKENGKRGGRKPKPNQPGLHQETQQVPEKNLLGSAPETQGKATNTNTNTNTNTKPPLPPDDGGGERDLHPAVKLSIEARKLGMQTQGSDPRLVELAEQGVAVDTFRAAIEEAKRAKGVVPSLGYVVAVLNTWAQQASKVAANGAAQPVRGGGVVALHSAATPDEAVLRRISEANGGESVQRLPDGRYRCGVRYYRPSGVEELSI